MEQNLNKHFLGTICKCEHEYETSGKGLRYLNGGACAECKKEYRQSDKGKASNKRYNQTDKFKDTQKRFNQSDKGKATAKRFNQSDKGKISAKKHRQSDKGKTSNKRFNQSDKGKAAVKRRSQTDKFKATQKRFNQSDKGKAAVKRANQSEKRKEWLKKQLVEHTQYAIGCNLRILIWHAFNKYTETGKIMSCKKYDINIPAICNYLGPHPNTLGKKGKYHIDHIIPLSKFDLNNPEYIKVAFSPENHQWLTAEANLKKGNKIPSDISNALMKQINHIGIKLSD